ncbi:hypothetical protein NVSP9465_02995 [Novosphingobium sp. CECT 9465]|nr:hypothetical protein NVSP9465_02995 [Novosphingobium sp. CECT 9465]
MFNLAAAAVYIAVILACGIASGIAFRAKRPIEEPARWILFGTLFAILGLSRIFNIEEKLRSTARNFFFDSRSYEGRWEYQAPVAGAAFALMAAASIALVLLAQRKHRLPGRLGKALMAADLAAFGMISLVGLRLISLHSVDALLFRGPHLNWIIDIGCSAAMIWAALRYRQLLLASRRR